MRKHGGWPGPNVNQGESYKFERKVKRMGSGNTKFV